MPGPSSCGCGQPRLSAVGRLLGKKTEPRSHLDTSDYFNGAATTQIFESSRSRIGFVVGAGTEWSFAPNWSFFSEFMYMGLEKDNQNFACCDLRRGRNRHAIPLRILGNDGGCGTWLSIDYISNMK